MNSLKCVDASRIVVRENVSYLVSGEVLVIEIILANSLVHFCLYT
jgi:hypothetical protein